MRTLIISLALAALLQAAALPAQEEKEKRWAAWQFYWENDAFAAFSGSDEYYTNGLRFSWVRDPNVVKNPEWTSGFIDHWRHSRIGKLLFLDIPPDIGYGHAFGQNFYTPDDITDPNPQLDDRPWAGYLYYSWLLQATQATAVDFRKDQPVQNLLEFQVGLVGPWAGAEFVQREWHELIEDDPPLGWDNQLDNEPTFNLIYLWRKKLGSTSFDIVPHGGATLGTVMTSANLGATVRLGRNISTFPQLLITPTNAAITQPRPTRTEYYVFVAADGRAVGHNIFLDGNVFRDGPEIDIDKERFVYDLKAGFSWRRKAWRIDYSFVRRSEEFAPPPGRDDGTHDFGSIVFSYQLWRPSEEQEAGF